MESSEGAEDDSIDESADVTFGDHSLDTDDDDLELQGVEEQGSMPGGMGNTSTPSKSSQTPSRPSAPTPPSPPTPASAGQDAGQEPSGDDEPEEERDLDFLKRRYPKLDESKVEDAWEKAEAVAVDVEGRTQFEVADDLLAGVESDISEQEDDEDDDDEEGEDEEPDEEGEEDDEEEAEEAAIRVFREARPGASDEKIAKMVEKARGIAQDSGRSLVEVAEEIAS